MSIISNKQELLESNTELRGQALEILEAGLEAIDTEKILRRKIENGILGNLENYERIFFVGIGKCALDGAKVIEDILGDYLTDGIALDVKSGNLNKIKSLVGTHPYPSEQNIEATKQILKMVENLTEKDLVICLISGGGSALFELPMSRFNLDTIIKKTKEMTARGADIYELNEFRKSISQVKGGKFAKLCSPAKVISLIFSDVLGNDLSVIASGPTFGSGVLNVLIASNHDALTAMKIKSEELGFDTNIETEILSGNASEVGKELALRKVEPKTCILFGGETTVKISKNNGIGGRNQELALSALRFIPEDAILVSASSDGWDNTDHAGAIADVELLQKAKSLGINLEEYLEKNDSYNFYKKVGDGAIYTEKLGSNVSDLCILIYK